MDFWLSILCGAGLACQFKQQMGHSAGNGVGERQATSIHQDGTVIVVDAFSSVETTFYMVLKEMKKIFAAKGLDLSGFDRLCSDFVGCFRKSCAQAQDISGLGNPEQQGLTIP